MQRFGPVHAGRRSRAGLAPGVPSARVRAMGDTSPHTGRSGGNGTAASRPSRMERVLFARVPLWFVLALVVVGAGGLVAYGALILHAIQGGQRLAWLQKPALFVAAAPSLVFDVREQTRNPF